MIRLFSFLIVLAAVFVQQCSTSTEVSPQQEQGNVAKSEVKGPANPANITGVLNEEPINNTNLSTMLEQPAPKIWFNFDCPEESSVIEICHEENLKQEMPGEALDVIDQFWKDTIGIRHLTIIRKNEITAQTYQDEILAYTARATVFEKNLEEIWIETPQGRRKMSQVEARDVSAYLMRISFDVIERSQKNQGG